MGYLMIYSKVGQYLNNVKTKFGGVFLSGDKHVK